MTLTRRSSTILAVTVLLAAAAVLVMIVGMNWGAPGGERAYASDPGAEAEVVAVQAANGLTTRDIDLPAVQAHCRSQTDQHYDDCVTVNQVLDALAGDCTDCSDLTYIYSTTTGRVIKILLLRKGLKGHIPAEIGSLEMLEELWLYTNELTGTIPAEMGDLSNLTWLFVSDNNLSGQIPENLNNLTLDRLWLHNNDFTGCVPYNLTLTREYKVDSGLAACAAPAGDGTPTPAPTAPAGTPTPSPTPEPNATPTPTPESGDATFDFLRNANCTEERLREIYGEDFTDENTDPPSRVDDNGIGWASFFNTWWWNADRTKRVSCIAVLYDNVESALFQRGFTELRRYIDGTTLDVLFEKKLRGLPELGSHYVAAWIEQGERRSEQDDGSFQDEIEIIRTAAVMRWDNFTVTIVESTAPDPDLAVQVHRPVSNLNSMASMIDDYIDDYVQETASTRGYDIIELTPRSGASVAGVESDSLLGSANDQ